MSPYSRKTGKRYAAGSHTTFEHYPRVCSAEGCLIDDGRIVMSHQYPLWFETGADGVPRSWHFACREAKRRGLTEGVG